MCVCVVCVFAGLFLFCLQVIFVSSFQTKSVRVGLRCFVLGLDFVVFGTGLHCYVLKLIVIFALLLTGFKPFFWCMSGCVDVFAGVC